MVKVICYLSNGYPTPEETIKTADYYVEGQCDIIEIDLPTDNPYLDNELIGGRMKASYQHDPSFSAHLETVKTIREKHPTQEMLFLSYESSIKTVGVEKFIGFCQEHNILDIILVGNEDNVVKNQLMAAGIKVSSFIPYHLPQEEIDLAKNSNGFIYLQAKSTGKEKEGCHTLKECIDYLRGLGLSQPIYCGMGISTREDIELVEKSGGDGAFIGSAVLKLQAEPAKLVSFIQELKGN